MTKECNPADALHVLSHERRTPLPSMLLHAQGLRSGHALAGSEIPCMGEVRAHVSVSNADRREPPSAPPNGEALERPGNTKEYAALRDLCVLCVDDDRSIREAVLEVLALSGARVELAASAAEAIVIIDAWKPQVILCDIAMPLEDGYTFMRKLRAREASTGATMTPSLALTSLSTENDRRRALAAGFQLHVTKPVDIDRLREAVHELAKWTTSRSTPPARH